jgi:predicted phosphodiesterase
MNKQQQEIIESYMSDFAGRDFANRTLARRIVTENPALFDAKDIEKVRYAILYKRGAMGNVHRKHARPEYNRDVKSVGDFIKKHLKPPVEPKNRTFILPKKHKKVLILSDLHIPYHSIESIQIALEYGMEAQVDAIYINGDLIDFAKISRWAKDPTKPNVQVEVDMVQEFLYGLSCFGLPIYYKMGNHEDRWNAYLLQNAPELYDFDLLQMDTILNLDEFGVQLIDSRVIAHFGKLLVIHGHEFGESVFSPVNPARGLFLKAKTSIVAGHNHQTSSHHENDLNGNPTATFSLGCLCDMSPDYRPFGFTKWNHGFAVVEIEENGYFTVHNKRIIEGRVR